MADIIGAEKVCKYINAAKRSRFKIWGVGENQQTMPPRYASSTSDLEDEFNNFADMFSTSQEEYYIVLSDTDEDAGASVGKDGKPKRGQRRAALRTRFLLNEKAPRTFGAPGATSNNGQPLTEARIIEILELRELKRQPAQPAITLETIGLMLDKQAHKYQIETLVEKMERMQKDNAIAMANIVDDLTDQMENEEFQESEDRKERTLLKAKEMEISGIKQIAQIAGPILQDVINAAYVFTGKKVLSDPKMPLRAVAGKPPAISASTGYVIPVSDKIGELEPYGPAPVAGDPPADIQKFVDDQQAKILKYSQMIYSERDPHVGDDMALLYKLWKDMPTKFEQVIDQLRTEMGPQE